MDKVDDNLHENTKSCQLTSYFSALTNGKHPWHFLERLPCMPQR